MAVNVANASPHPPAQQFLTESQTARTLPRQDKRFVNELSLPPWISIWNRLPYRSIGRRGEARHEDYSLLSHRHLGIACRQYFRHFCVIAIDVVERPLYLVARMGCSTSADGRMGPWRIGEDRYDWFVASGRARRHGQTLGFISGFGGHIVLPKTDANFLEEIVRGSAAGKDPNKVVRDFAN
jgi:hypothetical protein